MKKPFIASVAVIFTLEKQNFSFEKPKKESKFDNNQNLITTVKIISRFDKRSLVYRKLKEKFRLSKALFIQFVTLKGELFTTRSNINAVRMSAQNAKKMFFQTNFDTRKGKSRIIDAKKFVQGFHKFLASFLPKRSSLGSFERSMHSRSFE